MPDPEKGLRRNKGEIGVAIFLLIGGLAYLLAAIQYPMGEWAAPGAGLMPRLLGWVFIGLSAYLLGLNLFSISKRQRAIEAQGAGIPPSLKVPLLLTAILILYWAALLPLGFFLSTFLAMVVLSRYLGLEGWIKPILLGFGTVILFYLLFMLALDVPLPTGTIWGK